MSIGVVNVFQVEVNRRVLSIQKNWVSTAETYRGLCKAATRTQEVMVVDEGTAWYHPLDLLYRGFLLDKLVYFFRGGLLLSIFDEELECFGNMFQSKGDLTVFDHIGNEETESHGPD